MGLCPRAVSTLTAPALSLVPSQEEAMLRETVSSIAASFGPDYTRRINAAGEPPLELWDALASRGYLGVNIPEEYDGGGPGVAAPSAGGGEGPAGGGGPPPVRRLPRDRGR